MRRGRGGRNLLTYFPYFTYLQCTEKRAFVMPSAILGTELWRAGARWRTHTMSSTVLCLVEATLAHPRTIQHAEVLQPPASANTTHPHPKATEDAYREFRIRVHLNPSQLPVCAPLNARNGTKVLPSSEPAVGPAWAAPPNTFFAHQKQCMVKEELQLDHVRMCRSCAHS